MTTSIIIQRHADDLKTTVSPLTAINSTGILCLYAVEDSYHKTKIPGETRIPAGRYNIIPRYHGKFYTKYKERYGHKFALEIENVPNFTDVLCHIGNFSSDTEGCVLINEGGNLAEKRYRGIGSAVGYQRFYNFLEKDVEEGKCTITLMQEPWRK